MTERQYQSYRDGFAWGLLKCASNLAAQAIENAAKIVVNPHSERTMAAIGHDIFDLANRPGSPIRSFGRYLLARPHQIQTIHDTMRAFDRALAGAGPEEAARITAQRDAMLHQQFAELGTAASPKLRFLNRAVPAAAAAGITLPIAYAGGHIGGQRWQRDVDVDALRELPIHKRLQYAIFPGSMLPPRPPTPPPSELPPDNY